MRCSYKSRCCCPGNRPVSSPISLYCNFGEVAERILDSRDFAVDVIEQRCFVTDRIGDSNLSSTIIRISYKTGTVIAVLF